METEKHCESQTCLKVDLLTGFEEALAFARNFNLDVQEVDLAKASGLMQELSTWADTKTKLLF